MKMEITRRVVQKETVDIDLPYYYKHDLELDEADIVIYGKVEEKRCTKITITSNRDGDQFELEFEQYPASYYGAFMEDEYKSSEAEYLEAKAKLLKAAESA